MNPAKRNYRARFRWPFLYKHVIPVSPFLSPLSLSLSVLSSPRIPSNPEKHPNRAWFRSRHTNLVPKFAASERRGKRLKEQRGGGRSRGRRQRGRTEGRKEGRNERCHYSAWLVPRANHSHYSSLSFSLRNSSSAQVHCRRRANLGHSPVNKYPVYVSMCARACVCVYILNTWRQVMRRKRDIRLIRLFLSSRIEPNPPK